MTITTFTSREFSQSVGRVKLAASRGPVVITNHGRPAYVLLSIKEYRKISAKRNNVAKLISRSEAAQIEFDPPHLRTLLRPADL